MDTLTSTSAAAETAKYTLFTILGSASAGLIIGLLIGFATNRNTATKILLAISGASIFGTTGYILRKNYLKKKGWD